MYRTVKNTDKPAVSSGNADFLPSKYCIKFKALCSIILFYNLNNLFLLLFVLGQSDGFENGSSGEISDDNLLDLHKHRGAEPSAQHGRSLMHHGNNYSGLWSNSSRSGIPFIVFERLVIFLSENILLKHTYRPFGLVQIGYFL